MSTFIINLNDTIAMSDSAVVELAKVINTCQPCVKEAETTCNDVVIVGIVCLTVFVSLLAICFSSFAYFAKRNTAIANQKSIDELNQQITKLKTERDKSVKDKNDAEKKLQITLEQKEYNRFMDFCYDMAKSTDMENDEMKKECWGILKEKFNISPKTQ